MREAEQWLETSGVGITTIVLLKQSRQRKKIFHVLDAFMNQMKADRMRSLLVENYFIKYLQSRMSRRFMDKIRFFALNLIFKTSLPVSVIQIIMSVACPR